jgi:hypothetical protein
VPVYRRGTPRTGGYPYAVLAVARRSETLTVSPESPELLREGGFSSFFFSTVPSVDCKRAAAARSRARGVAVARSDRFVVFGANHSWNIPYVLFYIPLPLLSWVTVGQ